MQSQILEKIKTFLNSPAFDPRYTFRVHIVQLVLIVVAIILTIARVSMKVPTTRAHTLSLTMGLKSLVVIGYQLLTEHVAKYRKWASLKAYAILNSVEVVFWSVAMGLLFKANATFCSGASCGLTWIVSLINLALFILAIQTAIVSILDFRYFRTYGVPRGTTMVVQSDVEDTQSLEYVRERSLQK